MDDYANPRVQAHAGAALVNFSEDCPKNILGQYLDPIIGKLEQVLSAKFTEVLYFMFEGYFFKMLHFETFMLIVSRIFLSFVVMNEFEYNFSCNKIFNSLPNDVCNMHRR